MKKEFSEIKKWDKIMALENLKKIKREEEKEFNFRKKVLEGRKTIIRQIERNYVKRLKKKKEKAEEAEKMLKHIKNMEKEKKEQIISKIK